MILLDTNVISALMLPVADPTVREWLNRHPADTLFLSTVTVAEIGYGLAILPDGKRRRSLEQCLERFLERAFDQRLLSFDPQSARHYAEIMSRRRSLGRPMGMADGQIASIARAHKLAIATRNGKDFEDCGLEVIDPYR